MSTAGPGPDSDGLVHAVYLSDALAKAVGAGIDDNADPAAYDRAVAGARPLGRRLRRAESPGRASVSTRSSAASTERISTERAPLLGHDERPPASRIWSRYVVFRLFGLETVTLGAETTLCMSREAQHIGLDSRATRRGGSAAVAVAVALALTAVVGPAGSPSPAHRSGQPRTPGRLPADAWVGDAGAPTASCTSSPASETPQVAADAAAGDSARPTSSASSPTSRCTRSAPCGENDPMRSQQWALDRTSFESAWSVTRGRGVIVAVVDSGVEADHQDLAGSVLPGIDYVEPGGDGRIDPDGHGTHVAGHHRRAREQRARHRGRGARREASSRCACSTRTAAVSRPTSPRASSGPTDHGARVINVSLGGGAVARHRSRRCSTRTARARSCSRRPATTAQAGNAPMYPGGVPRGDRGRRGRHQPHAPVVRQHRQLHRRRRRPASASCSTWGSSTDRVRGRERHVDGDAVRVGRGRADHRRQPVAVGGRESRRSWRSTATPPRPEHRVFGHGLINPRRRVGTPRSRTRRASRPRARATSIVSADGRVRAVRRRARSTATSPAVALRRTDRRLRAHAGRQGLLARRRRRLGLRVRQRPQLRLDGRSPAELADRRHERDAVRQAATSCSVPTVASSRSATRTSTARPATCTSTPACSTSPSQRTARATGSSRPTVVCSRSATRASTARPATCTSRRR